MSRISRKITPTWGSLSPSGNSASNKSLRRTMSSDSTDDSVVSLPLEEKQKEQSKLSGIVGRGLFHLCSFRNFVCCGLFAQCFIFILLALAALLGSGYNITDSINYDAQSTRISWVKKLIDDNSRIHDVISTYIDNNRLNDITVDQASEIIHPALSSSYGVDAYVFSQTGDDILYLQHEKTANGTITNVRTYTTEAYNGATATGSKSSLNAVNIDTSNYSPTSVGFSPSAFAGQLFSTSQWFTAVRYSLSKFFLSDPEISIDGERVNSGGIWSFKRFQIDGNDWVGGALISFAGMGSTLSTFSQADEQVLLAHLENQRVLVSTESVNRQSTRFSDISGSTEADIVSSLEDINIAVSTGEKYLASGNTVVTRSLDDYDQMIHVVSYKSRFNYGAAAVLHPAVIVTFTFAFIITAIVGIILLFSFFVPLHLLSQKLKKISFLKDDTEEKGFIATVSRYASKVHWKWYPFGEIRELQKIASLSSKATTYLRKYAPDDVIQYNLLSNEELKLGMEPCKMSILFSDLVEFTALASRLNAEKFVALLADYFEEMIAVIEKNNGQLDKLVGDAVMCLFVANQFKQCHNHEEMGVKTALEMQERLGEMNAIWKKKNLPSLKMRIGVATGESMLGNIGSQEHYSFTAISNSVNIASRLESLNTYFGTRQLIEQKTYHAVKDKYLCYWVDSVAMKGRNTGTHVYELRRLRKKASGAEIEIEEQMLGLRNMLVERKFSKLISKIEELSKNKRAPKYIQKLKKRSRDLVLCGEVKDVDVSLFLSSKGG